MGKKLEAKSVLGNTEISNSDVKSKWNKGSSREENIVDKLVEMFKFWTNQDEAENGSTPIKPHQLYVYGPSYSFIFKWIVSREDLEFAAKAVKVKLKKDQKTLRLSLGEYEIELEEESPE
jgi:hypothetical protein